ncbi:MAG: gluconate permease [Planctomycetaceae bacterium]|nr:gluconate permease [Planctomycetaceae bacterium]
MIMVLRINAFIALITAAIVVSLMAPGELGEKISRVAEAFGTAAGNIGIVIALAAVIGECMMVSGAADCIVQFFIRLLGEKRAPWALMFSGFVLAVPVFFDTVFYLLVPLARSLYKKTGKNYLLSLLAIACGGAITHTLVPPTPGPLLMADNLKIDVGAMMMGGAAVALPAAIIGLLFSRYLDNKMHVPFRELGTSDEFAPPAEEDLPPLGLSLLPVALPVLLISSNTIVKTLSVSEKALAAGTSPNEWNDLLPYTSIIGNPNLAMLVATAVAMGLVWLTRKPTLQQLSETAERSLMSGGVIILITAGGGAFGGMLKAAEIGPAIQSMFQSDSAGGTGIAFLMLGYFIAVLLKIAVGSSTVAMITASGMLAAMMTGDVSLGYHPVYLATAIGAGSLMGSWMNDSGFWIFCKMGALTEAESLKSWTVLLAVLSIVSMAVTVVLALALPMSP